MDFRLCVTEKDLNLLKHMLPAVFIFDKTLSHKTQPQCSRLINGRQRQIIELEISSVRTQIIKICVNATSSSSTVRPVYCLRDHEEKWPLLPLPVPKAKQKHCSVLPAVSAYCPLHVGRRAGLFLPGETGRAAGPSAVGREVRGLRSQTWNQFGRAEVSAAPLWRSQNFWGAHRTSQSVVGPPGCLLLCGDGGIHHRWVEDTVHGLLVIKRVCCC